MLDSKAPNLALAKKLQTFAWIVSAIVLALVAAMQRIHIDLPAGVDLSVLPGFHAVINATTAVVLAFAYYFIRKKQVENHRRAIYVAVGLSLVFLLSYVTYHITTPETIFGDLNGDKVLDEVERAAVGGARGLYLVLLLSHIALAAISFPFILFTFIRAYTNQFDRHKKMARWVFPIWMYVAVTGPVVYWLLRPYY